MCHWTASGAVIRGAAGEWGVFQLMPATAFALGITDPSDVNQNIRGGISYLAQLFSRFGDWALAVQHYNGSGPAAAAYAQAVMARAVQYGFGQAPASSAGPDNSGDPVSVVSVGPGEIVLPDNLIAVTAPDGGGGPGPLFVGLLILLSAYIFESVVID